MKFLSWEHIFGPITGKKNPKRTLANAKWIRLEQDTNFNGISYAKGSEYKFWETENFGWVAFNINSLTPDGNRPEKFLHRY